MKILQVISYGYVAGGAEKSVLLLKENLRRRGHDVMVVASNHNSPPSSGAESVRRFSDVEFSEIDGPTVSLAAKTIRHLWYAPAHAAIRTVIANFKPDIVHFHVMGQLSPSAIFASGNVPAVVTVHGPEEYVKSMLEWSLPKHLFKKNHIAVTHLTLRGMGYYAYFRYVQRPVYMYGFRKHVKMLIAPSRYMAGVLKKENYGVAVQHIYNGIDLPKRQPLRSTRRLLFVGRLEHVKGIDVLLQAMCIVSRRIPDVGLCIVGDGAMRSELEAFVGRHQLEKQVIFCGWLDAYAVSKQYAMATAVVIPSVWPENLPTVCLEALAIGRPVIGSNSGGIPELIQDGVTGRIVAVGNKDDLAKAILDILSRPDMAAMSKECVKSVQNFKITSFVKSLERLYRQLLDNALEEA